MGGCIVWCVLQVVMYGDAEEALKKKESILYLGNHQSTGKSINSLVINIMVTVILMSRVSFMVLEQRNNGNNKYFFETTISSTP